MPSCIKLDNQCDCYEEFFTTNTRMYHCFTIRRVEYIDLFNSITTSLVRTLS